MTIFAVMATDLNPALEAIVTEKYPGNRSYRLSVKTWLVTDKGTPQEISERLGINKGWRYRSGGVAHAVFILRRRRQHSVGLVESID